MHCNSAAIYIYTVVLEAVYTGDGVSRDGGWMQGGFMGGTDRISERWRVAAICSRRIEDRRAGGGGGSTCGDEARERLCG